MSIIFKGDKNNDLFILCNWNLISVPSDRIPTVTAYQATYKEFVAFHFYR
jgi:hypothetical protein